MSKSIYIAIAIFIFVLVIAGKCLINGQYLVALSIFFADLCIVFGVINCIEYGMVSGLHEYFTGTWSKILAGISMVFSIFAVLNSSAFNNDLQIAHLSAFQSFVSIDTKASNCKPTTPELRKISELGLQACAIQNSSSQLSATGDLAKGLYLGPTLSVADSAYSLNNEPSKDNCALAFKKAFNICPNAFLLMSAAQQANLLSALK